MGELFAVEEGVYTICEAGVSGVFGVFGDDLQGVRLCITIWGGVLRRRWLGDMILACEIVRNGAFGW